MKKEDKLKAIKATLNRYDRPYGMAVDEYLDLCEFIDEHKIKNVADVGVGKGYSHLFMKELTNAENVYAIDGYVDSNYTIGERLPYDTHIYFLKIPDDIDYFEKFLYKNKIDFVLLDDGHHEDIVTLEVLACYNAKVKFIAIHDVNTRTRRCIERIRRLYGKEWHLNLKYNGLVIYEIGEDIVKLLSKM